MRRWNALTFGGVGASGATIYFTDVEVVTSSGGGTVEVYNPNGLSAVNSNSESGESGSGHADLTTGTLGILSTGDFPAGGANLNAPFTLAQMGDTITATGATAGAHLGINLSVDGTSTLSDPTQSFTALVVAAYAPGTFDNGGSPIFGEGFVLGPGTLDPSSYFSAIGVTNAGSFGSGPQNIPLSVSFDTLGANFQFVVGLATEDSSSEPTGTTWDVDYNHTLTVALAAPDGVSLTSGSGLPGTRAATPEPNSLAMLACGLLLLAAFGKARCQRV